MRYVCTIFYYPFRRITSGTLRNEDFRQLLSRKAAQSSTTSSATTTSITPSSNASQNQATHSFSHRQTNEFVLFFF